jgi:tryptophanyl-tRNA synthetase
MSLPFNHQMGDFVLPSQNSGRQHAYSWDKWGKSKSANNIINIFLEENLRKQVMGIETDSTPLEIQKIPRPVMPLLYIILANQGN